MYNQVGDCPNGFSNRHAEAMIAMGGAVISGPCDPVLVILSALIAVLSSYTALDLAERVTAAPGRLPAGADLLEAAYAKGFALGKTLNS